MSAQTDSGEPPESENLNDQAKISKKKSNGSCFGLMLWKCVAVVPVIIMVLFYNMPFLLDEYRAIYGYAILYTLECYITIWLTVCSP